MKTVNYGDAYTHRMTLRLTDEQMDFLARISKIMGVTPSEYIRMTVNMSMVSTSKDLAKMESGEFITGKDGGMSNENIKTDINNLV